MTLVGHIHVFVRSILLFLMLSSSTVRQSVSFVFVVSIRCIVMMEVRSLVSGDNLMSVAKSEVLSLAGLKRSVASELGVTRFRVKLCDCVGDELGECDLVPEVMAEPGKVVVWCILLEGIVPAVEDQVSFLESIRTEDVSAFDKFVGRGWSVAFATPDGDTPLNVATAMATCPQRPDLYNRPEPFHFVKVLLEAKASTNAADARGERPVHIAVSQGDRLLTRLLLSARADQEDLIAS